jgi:hypothetical protein
MCGGFAIFLCRNESFSAASKKLIGRDQKIWRRVLRPIALKKYKRRMILSRGRYTLRRIVRNEKSTLKIRVKRRLSICWHRPAVGF